MLKVNLQLPHFWVLFSNLMLVLERKISMRKPREELVKRGVLLEDSEQGEFAHQWYMSVCILGLWFWLGIWVFFHSFAIDGGGRSALKTKQKLFIHRICFFKCPLKKKKKLNRKVCKSIEFTKESVKAGYI